MRQKTIKKIYDQVRKNTIKDKPYVWIINKGYIQKKTNLVVVIELLGGV
jgi:hypothetical protein